MTTQIGVAPTGNQLLGLHKKLNLANTAAPQFQIMPLRDNFRVTAHRMHLSLHRMDIFNRRKVEITPPNIGL